MKTTKAIALCLFGVLITFDGFTSPPRASWSGQTTREEKLASTEGIVLEGSDKLVSPDAFRPPVEITIAAKTDSTNLRIGYVADQVIFNWEQNRDELRVDGGPAGSQQIDGLGQIPKDTYVTIKWVVTPKHQAVYVDGQLRFEHCGNYAEMKRRVSVFPADGSVVTVKSITVKQQ
ncbi:MAG TPA: hypothetical protein VG938_12830 [Verrucomicrobiae bacterium]|jgi:hypothetical protein|nr:hypothetical protein [Verrucomicrobiae bacterium]